MTRGYTLLAAALLLLGATACRAGEIGAAQLPVDPAPPVAAPLAPVAPGGGCGCYDQGGHNDDCWQRLLDWLTYCPPRTPCHCCCCKGCTPCCTPVYMYFLDRCSCTLGYKGPARCDLCGPTTSAPPSGNIYAAPTSAAGTPTSTSSSSISSSSGTMTR